MLPTLILAVAALTLGNSPGDHDIVAGARIGRIRIGIPAATAHALLGAPRGSSARKDGFREEWWLGGRHEADTLRILIQRDKVVQVSATSATFLTAEGLSTAADPRRIVARRLHRSSYWLHGSGGGMAYYYDDVARGIAWVVTGAGIKRPGEQLFRVYAVIVHAPGRVVTVDADMEPMNPGEACTPETPSRCETL